MPKIPTPREFGLPERFDSWRAGQEQLIDSLGRSTKRVDLVCAPTGFGKSAALVARALQSKRPTAIVTHTRGLMDQYSHDFKEIGMVDLRGRANYKCDAKPDDPDYTCEDGYAASCPYKGTVACACSAAEFAASTSNLVVTNYAKWTAAKRFGQGLSHITQVIFDEGDLTYQALAQAMQVELHCSEINNNLKMDFPDHPEDESMALWRAWAGIAKVEADNAMQAALARITGIADPKPTWVRHYTHMRNLVRRLSILATANPQEWIVDVTDDGYVFDPISPGRYSESGLLFRTPHVIAASATIRPKSGFIIGIAKDNFNFYEFDSDFDPRRCLIYYIPTMRVDSEARDLSMLWTRHDQIAARRQDRNGLVHTISYPRQEELRNVSRFRDRIFFNQRGESPTRTIEDFINSYPGAIYASPSIERGYDFLLKAAEWQMICKIPFEPPSRIVKAREAVDKEYRSYQAMQRLIQAVGRIVRDRKDQGETFLPDMHLEWFLGKNRHLAPASFWKFLKRVEIIPPPPPRL